MKTILISVLVLISSISFSQKQWEAINFPSSDDLVQISFTSPSKGWILSFADFDEWIMHRTVDGGKNWQKILSDTLWGEGITEFEMLDDSIGFMKGWGFDMGSSWESTYTTVNGGASWKRSQSYNDVFISTLKGKKTNYYSYNNYNNYDTIYTVLGAKNKKYNFQSSTCVENNGTANLWAGNQLGEICRSIDSGSTWIVEKVTNGGIQTIDFLDDDTGVILDDLGEIRLTNDGGVSWQKINTNINSSNFQPAYLYQSICLGEDKTIFAIGDQGTIYSYDEKGKIWNIDLTGNEGMNEIIFDGEYNWAVGNKGKLWRTKKMSLSVDNNDIKEPQLSAYPNPFTSIVGLSSDNEFSSVLVYNSLGKKVLEKVNHQLKEIELNLSHLDPGMYFLQINYLNSTSSTLRVIKK